MARLFTLSSSSSGNCTYISASGSSLLIDLGISATKAISIIKENNEDIDSIKGILITHDHIDHKRGLPIFLKKHKVPIYATEEVIENIRYSLNMPNDTIYRDVTPNVTFEISNMRITPYSTSHDSATSVCYKIETPDEHLVSIMTDTGYVTEDAKKGLIGSELIVLESNHDPELLFMNQNYPMMLKRRITSNLGHLSNDQSSDFATYLYQNGTRRFLLAHLSKENNNMYLAKETLKEKLSRVGAKEGVDYELDVAPYETPSKMIRL